MFTGLDPDSSNDTKAVGRLIAAGMLTHGKRGLGTTDRWREGMLKELSRHPGEAITVVLENSLSSSFPGAAEREVDMMARIMLYVEAREAGWQD